MLNTISSHYVNLLQESTSLVNEGLQDLIKRLYPEVAPLVAARFNRIESDVLGTRALALLLVLSTHQLDRLQSDEAAKHHFNGLMKRMTTLYILENITDDFCSITISGTEMHYKYAAMMSHFYSLVEALVAGRMTLQDTFAEVSQFPACYSEMPVVGKISELFDVRADNLLALHLQTISDILQALQCLDEEDERLRPLIEKAYTGLLNRYKVSRLCLEMPQVSIYEALERGKATILTDFHSAFVLLAAASIDPDIHSQAIAQFEILETVIDHSSYVHRILNDTGIAGLHPHEAIKIFSLYPPTSGASPRAYIKEIHVKLSKSVSRYFARLIKDVKEDEANIVLDSPCDPSLNAAEAIIQNLELLNQQFITSMTTLDELLPHIGHKYIHALFPEFIEFERNMYSQLVSEGGEYVETNKRLLFSMLNSIIATESPMSFVQNLLAQSLEKRDIL